MVNPKMLIGVILFAVIGFALYPVLDTSITAASLTGVLDALADVVPILYILTIVAATGAGVYKAF